MGHTLATFFDPARVEIKNVAHAGTSSAATTTETGPRAFPIRAGDFVLLVFGINDGSTPPGTRRRNESRKTTGVVHTYGWYMSKMVTDIAMEKRRACLSADRYHPQTSGPTRRSSSPMQHHLVPYPRLRAHARSHRTRNGQRKIHAMDEGCRDRRCTSPFLTSRISVADKYEAMGREQVDKFYSDHNHRTCRVQSSSRLSIVSGLKAFKAVHSPHFFRKEVDRLEAAPAKYDRESEICAQRCAASHSNGRSAGSRRALREMADTSPQPRQTPHCHAVDHWRLYSATTAHSATVPT
jgi:hypothetical protein